MDRQTRLIERIRAVAPELSTDVLEFRRPDLVFMDVEKDVLVALLTRLRNEGGFTHLVLLTAVDWIEDKVFQLTYLIHNPEEGVDLGARVKLDRDLPVMRSLHHLWPTAATYQRELKEMFGIDFPGSPRLDRPLILEGWEGPPPYRRDFDTLRYAEETYFPRPGRSTIDPEAHMRERRYPDNGGGNDQA